jgi:hypothetical protein
MEGPQLLESKEVHDIHDESGCEQFEYLRDFTTVVGPVDPAQRRFLLSDFGLGEPEDSTHGAISGSSQFIWFFLLLIAGNVLIVLARNLRGARTLTDHLRSPSAAETTVTHP